jgi:dihydropteroate synthase
VRAPARTLRTTRGIVALGDRPWLMGIVNASPDSFSEAGERRTLEQRVELAAQLLGSGADMIDIGGESAITNRPAVGVEEEIERVAALVERVSSGLGALVSIDTYKPEVAEVAIAAGAAIVNDVSGLRDPRLADVCARTGAALVLMHTRAAPKQKLLDPAFDGRVVADIEAFLTGRMEAAVERGMVAEQLLLDPGPDFGKTPAQTVEALQGLERLHALGRPLLLAVSRKDFIGALTHRPPRQRLGGTLAAIGYGLDAGAHVLRVHDVAATADFVAVRAALRGDTEVEGSLRLADELRWETAP